MKNILGNKQQLIQRTQLTGATRGTAYHILGRKDSTNTEVSALLMECLVSFGLLKHLLI